MLVKEMREAQLLGEDVTLKRKADESTPTQSDLMTMTESKKKTPSQE
jgi:hypothetical protein